LLKSSWIIIARASYLASTNEKQSKMNTVVKLHRQLNETNCTIGTVISPELYLYCILNCWPVKSNR